MSDVKIEKVSYKNFGQCLRISNGIIEAVITVDIGPRVVRLAKIGGENFFFEDIDRNCVTEGEMLDAVFGKGSKWYIYGGHRLWLSPEDMPLTYCPDNDPVTWSEIPGGVELTPPAQQVNELQLKIRITMAKDKPKVTVDHYATNLSDITRKQAMWALTVLGNGGLEVVPQPLHDTGLLANRVLAVWPYADMSDDRVYWGKKYITLRQDVNISSAFKFGINNERGWAAYFNHGGLFVKKYNHNPNGLYPDGGMSFETYTNNFIMEMETLGELTSITPGSTVFHQEEWTLIDKVERPDPKDEMTIDALVNLYIEK